MPSEPQTAPDRRRARGATAPVAVISAPLAGGWTGVILLTALSLVLVGAVCWVIADPERPERLALLITSWRSRTPARTTRSVTTAEPKIPRAAPERKAGTDKTRI